MPLADCLTIFRISSHTSDDTTAYSIVSEDHYFRGVKNAAEECLELYGYLFILIAAIEFFIAERKLWEDDIAAPNPSVRNNTIQYLHEDKNHKEPLPY